MDKKCLLVLQHLTQLIYILKCFRNYHQLTIKPPLSMYHRSRSSGAMLWGFHLLHSLAVKIPKGITTDLQGLDGIPSFP